MPNFVNRLPAGERGEVRQASVDRLDNHAQGLRRDILALNTGGGYASMAMQSELNAVEADLARLNRSPTPTPGSGHPGNILTSRFAEINGVTPSATPSPTPPADPIRITNVDNAPVRIYEDTSEDGTTSVVVENGDGHVLGTYAEGSTVDLEIESGVAQVQVSRDTDVSVNIETSDENILLDVDGGTSDINVTGNEHSNTIEVSTEGDVTVDGGNGHNQIDVDGANQVEIRAGDGHDTISATNIATTATIDTGAATDYDVESKTGRLSWLGIGKTETTTVRGSDTVTVDAGGDVHVTTGDGRDNITVERAGRATVNAGSDNDIIVVEQANQATVDAGADHDTVDTYGANRSDIRGGTGNDYIRTGNGVDTIRGGSGDDVIYGGGGRDQIHGEGGDDYIDAGRGNDTVNGGAGNDILSGNHGDDTINGGVDDDVLIAGTGRDMLDGGTDNHRVINNGPGRPTTEEGGDKVYYQAGDIRTNGETEELSDIPDGFDAEADLDRVNVDSGASNNFRDRVHDDLTTLRAIPTGAAGLDIIENAESGTGEQHDITIEELPLEERNGYARADDKSNAWLSGEDGDRTLDANSGTATTVAYNPAFSLDAVTDYDPATGEYNRDGRDGPPVSVLYHELAHAYDHVTGQLEPDDYSGSEGRDSGSEYLNIQDTKTADADPKNIREGDPIGNREREAVGLDIERPDGSSDSLHPDELTENALREALELETRKSYR